MRNAFESFALLALLLIALALLVLRIWSKKIRRALLGPTLGDLAEDWPRLDALLTPPLVYGLRRGHLPLDLQTLMNFVLVDRLSPVICNLLAAYGLRTHRFDLGEDNETESVEQAPCLTEQVLRTGLHACVYVQNAGRHPQSTDYPDLLLALFANPAAERALHAVGLTRLKVKYYLAHRKALPADPSEEIETDTHESEMIWVRIHNDDFSPMELVMNVLQEAFAYEPDEAKKLMMAVHCGEIISLGPFTREEGRMRVEKGIRLARAAGEPLLLSLASTPATAPQDATAKHASDSARNPFAPPSSLLDG